MPLHLFVVPSHHHSHSFLFFFVIFLFHVLNLVRCAARNDVADGIAGLSLQPRGVEFPESLCEKFSVFQWDKRLDVCDRQTAMLDCTAVTTYDEFVHAVQTLVARVEWGSDGNKLQRVYIRDVQKDNNIRVWPIIEGTPEATVEKLVTWSTLYLSNTLRDQPAQLIFYFDESDGSPSGSPTKKNGKIGHPP